jgi:hypothetical protein
MTMSQTLRGYLRADGRKGIRNVMAVAYLVECAHHVARAIVTKSDDADVHLIGFPGCYPNAYALKVMQAITTHPNVGGVLLISLGCESFNREQLRATIEASGRPVETLVIQENGGTASTIAKGLEAVARLQAIAAQTPLRAHGDLRTGDRHDLRRLGRHQRHHRQPRRRPGLRPPGRGGRGLRVRGDRRAGRLRDDHGRAGRSRRSWAWSWSAASRRPRPTTPSWATAASRPATPRAD